MNNTPFSIRFSPLEKHALKQIAGEKGITVGALIKSAVRKHTDLKRRVAALASSSPDINHFSPDSDYDRR